MLGDAKLNSLDTRLEQFKLSNQNTQHELQVRPLYVSEFGCKSHMAHMADIPPGTSQGIQPFVRKL